MFTDVTELITTLATKRPIFHSEADFQHAFAWEVHRQLPSASVRLEFPIQRQGQAFHVDVWVVQDGAILAVELKYKTRELQVAVGGESFWLKGQSAQDIGRYDFIKDIWRLEQVLSDRHGAVGYAILLTNDSTYWTPQGISGLLTRISAFIRGALSEALWVGASAHQQALSGAEKSR